ncbi:hypothetical protein ASE08_13665 [Rhizobacter sp. Root16D2]|nr:hypothetical protein ASC88_04680 [Rhizobacter sp. Root29]KQV98695.1 hypothetical protein ASC98_08510 [Rhizobacter sp. Root1238]KRB04949.1 hypothetical protein ASE08_13665 [Rhizobacter sp. Root16D2]
MHGANTAPQENLPELTRLRFIVGGQHGVNFFFVLSGFILTYRHHDWFDGGVRDGFEGGPPLVHGLFVLGTVAASVLCYRFVEVPWRRRLRGTVGADTLDTPAAAAPAASLQSQPRPALP